MNFIENIINSQNIFLKTVHNIRMCVEDIFIKRAVRDNGRDGEESTSWGRVRG